MDNLSRILYSTVMLLAVMVAWVLMQRRQTASKLGNHERGIVSVTAFIGAMLGAKLPFLFELGWEGLLQGTIWFADGKTILGGIFGGYLAVELAKYRFGIRTLTGDAFAIPVAVAVILGRVGCFVAGCCYGAPTTLPWGMFFARAGDAPGLLRHPTQLYEVLFHLVGVLLLWVAEQHRWLVGNRLKAYLISYLIYRFFSEWIRPEAKVFLAMTAYQWASLLLILVLVGLWVRDSHRLQLAAAS